jgi:prefoldin subunit 5
MADTTELRAAIEELAGKIQSLRAIITTLKEGQLVQGALDDIKTRVDEISTELDEIIAEAQGTDVPATGETPA